MFPKVANRSSNIDLIFNVYVFSMDLLETLMKTLKYKQADKELAGEALKMNIWEY